MKKNSITSKISPCCSLPFSVMYWFLKNLTLNSEADRDFIISKLSQSGNLTKEAWLILINSGTLETDSAMTKPQFIDLFNCKNLPDCNELKLIIEGFKIGNWTPETELPLNIATVDEVANGQTLIGNTYTKEQTDDKISDAKLSGIVGNATQANAPTPYDAVTYPNGLFETYVVRVPLTMPNSWGSAVTQLELDANNVYFDVKNGVITKSLSFKIPGKDAYQSYLDTTTDSPVKTEAEWILSLKGEVANPLIETVLSSYLEGEPTTERTNEIIVDYHLLDSGFVKNDFTIESGSTGFRGSFETSGLDKMNYKGMLLKASTADIPNYWSIYGVKENGDKVGIQRPSSLSNIVDLTFDVSDYKTIFINIKKPDRPPSITLYNESILPYDFEDAVKKSIIKSTYEINRSLDFFLNGSVKSNSYSPKIEGTGTDGFVLRADFIEQANPAFTRIIVDTKGRSHMNYKGVVTTTGIPAELNNYISILGVRADNTVKSLYKITLAGVTIDEDFEVSDFITIKIYLKSGLGYPIINFYDIAEQYPSFNSVAEYIDNKASSSPVGSETYLYFDKPDYVPIVNLIGDLPIDLVATVNMVMEFRQGKNVIFKTKITNKVQGSSTIYHPKKNWNVKFLNDQDKKVKLKFGSWAEDDAFHLKAFFNDRTLTRDTSGNKIMASILESRPYPENIQRSTFGYYSPIDRYKTNLMNDGDFYLDGFPIELRVNDSFHGIYIWRQRRTNEVYRMDSSNKKNIYLANNNLDALRFGNSFNASQWELKSPKISGYGEGLPITDADVLADINRLFEWFKSIKTTPANFNTEVGNYLVLNNLIDTVIGLQLNGIWDYYSNNINLVTNDGLIWRFFVHDMDWGSGIHNYYANAGTETEVKKLLWSGYHLNDYFWRDFIYPKILTQLKTRYTQLRNSGVINLDKIYDTISEIPSLIGQYNYDRDMERWADSGINNDKGVHSVAYLMQFYKWKIDYLDSIWIV